MQVISKVGRSKTSRAEGSATSNAARGSSATNAARASSATNAASAGSAAGIVNRVTPASFRRMLRRRFGSAEIRLTRAERANLLRRHRALLTRRARVGAFMKRVFSKKSVAKVLKKTVDTVYASAIASGTFVAVNSLMTSGPGNSPGSGSANVTNNEHVFHVSNQIINGTDSWGVRQSHLRKSTN
jgi:hypothetical protein